MSRFSKLSFYRTLNLQKFCNGNISCTEHHELLTAWKLRIAQWPHCDLLPLAQPAAAGAAGPDHVSQRSARDLLEGTLRGEPYESYESSSFAMFSSANRC